MNQNKPRVYFICEPAVPRVVFYETEDMWKEAMKDFDFSGYCDESWDPAVEEIFAGILPMGYRRKSDDYDCQEFYDFLGQYTTHTTIKNTLALRPDDVDEDGYSESTQRYWHENWDEICDYSFEAKTS